MLLEVILPYRLQSNTCEMYLMANVVLKFKNDEIVRRVQFTECNRNLKAEDLIAAHHCSSPSVKQFLSFKWLSITHQSSACLCKSVPFWNSVHMQWAVADERDISEQNSFEMKLIYCLWNYLSIRYIIITFSKICFGFYYLDLITTWPP